MHAVVWPIALSAIGAVTLAGWIAAQPDAERASAGPVHVAAAGGGSLTWVLMGAVLITLRPRNVLGWLFLALGTFAAWQVGLAAYGGYGIVVARPSWPGADLAAAAGSVQFVPAVFATSTVVPAFYPNGHLVSRSSRRPVAAAGTAITLMILAMPFLRTY
ncbi:hypothetical protein [Streptomyces sp. NPDC058694]|uniref:hypothetical protein n=1 Tax=Streptomyces sp. NPDC058694 TaxID=3346603 RepID=UPI0036633C5B